MEAALAELMTAVLLRTKIADLSAVTAAKGASLVGIEDAGNKITATTVEGALAELATAQALRATIADLISTAAGKGAAMIGVPDGGGYFTAGGWNANVDLALQKTYSDMAPKARLAAVTTGDGASLIGIEDAGNKITATTVEGALAETVSFARGGTGQVTGNAALTALQTLASAQVSLISLADAATTTAPEIFTRKHTTSGIAAAGFGALSAVDLHNAFPAGTPVAGSGVLTRAMTDVTSWTTATSAAETSQRAISLLLGGTLTKVAGFGFNSATYPMIYIGNPTNNDGLRSVTPGGRIDLMVAGSAYWAFALTTECFGHLTIDGNTTVVGNLNASALSFKIAGATKNALIFTPTAPGSNNTASTEAVGTDFALGRTSTWATGALATQREFLIRKPTYAFVAASTLATAATLAIEGAPVAGGFATITTPLALWVQNGLSRLDISDATLVTADVLTLRHATSGTVLAGSALGVTQVVELQSTVSTNYRRAMTDTTTWTSATDTAEASKRVFSLMAAGAPATALDLRPAQALFASGTAAAPAISTQAQTDNGLYYDAANTCWALSTAGSQSYRFGSSGAAGALYIAAGNASISFSANGVSIGRNGGTGNMDFANTSWGYTWTAAGKNAWLFTPTAPGSNNTASAEAIGVSWALGRTSTWATGALATQREMVIKAPTYAFVAASTLTTAATLAIEAAPIAGAFATLTNSYAFWVQAGGVRFDGAFGLSKAPVAQQNTTGTATGFTAGGAAVGDTSTFTGGTGATAYRISDIVLALKNYGLLAA